MCALRNDKLQVFNNNTDNRIRLVCVELGYNNNTLANHMKAHEYPLTVGKMFLLGGHNGRR